MIFNFVLGYAIKIDLEVNTEQNKCVCIYTGCPRRNVPDFGRVFLMLKYTDITQKPYVQS